MNMAEGRVYRQGARAEAAERTHAAILAAVFEESATNPIAAITLNRVADRAGVTVQTVLRRFGSRDELIEQTIEHYANAVRKQRLVVPGDPRAAVDVIVTHYEEYGDRTLLLLGQETTDPLALRITEQGRATHDAWVAAAFTPRDEREHRLLVVATDLYTWKLLRRDRGLSAPATADHMHSLCRAITEQPEGD